MQTHRFGRKITLPATVKHESRMLIAHDIKKAELEQHIQNTRGADE